MWTLSSCSLILIILFSLFYENSGSLLFFRGRPRGKHGMLGSVRHVYQESKHGPVSEEQWFEQKLDHFNPADATTWKQRYFVNDQFYKKGGPVFLQLGGEGVADPVWLKVGQVVEYAKKYNALAVLLEHRYYGNSHPTPDMSVKNLQYLTSEQALADAANFQQYLTTKMCLWGSKWVVFGGSYSGSLAAWYRLKYPHLVSGAIAASAPVYALVDFQAYLAVVRDSLATVSDQCNDQIASAVTQLQKLVQDKSTWQTVQKKFRLCNDFDADVEKDVNNLFSSLAGNFEGVVQYNKDNRAFEGAKGTNITIDILCDIMTDNARYGSPLERFAAVNSLILDTYGEKCLDFKYSNMIAQLSATSWNSSASEGGRQWTYQTCVEFGFFQSSDLKDQPFGHEFPVSWFVDQCRDIFGPKYDLDLLKRGILWTNANYGGFGLKVSKVVFPNGSIDPWHALGIRKDLSEDAPAIFINGTAHCADLYPASPDDLPQLTEARQRISNLIGQWLNE